jgi:hypothetical protein
LANAIYKNISFWICIEDWPRKLLGEFVFLSVAFSKKAIPNTPLPKIVEIKKNPYFNIKYLPNGREYLISENKDESGLKKLDWPEFLQIFTSHSGILVPLTLSSILLVENGYFSIFPSVVANFTNIEIKKRS